MKSHSIAIDTACSLPSGAELFLQFCLEEIGPSVYNQAIAEAQIYMQEKVLDLENACYTPESTYWVREEKRAAQGRKSKS